MILGQSSTPPGLRLYAIGDVHGCDRLLGRMHERILADLAASPAPDHRIIHIGDYVDRGPDSAGVLRRVATMSRSDPRVLCLKGNHEALLIGFMTDPTRWGDNFLYNGGVETLRSYGIRVAYTDAIHDLSAALRQAMTREERTFLDGLLLSLRSGDYFFCHAGVRPGLPLAAQREDDLLWIREPFLHDRREYEAVIVHGHTPSPETDIRPNRIDIDTGAVFAGTLTCLVLEGRDYRLIQVR